MPVQVLSLKKSKFTGINWGFAGENLKYSISKIMGGYQNMMHDSQNVRKKLYF
jgi:hypothetical protein